MQDSSWPRYTLTAVIGVIAGLVTTYTGMTMSNTAEVAALKVRADRVEESLKRFEDKLDRALQRR